MRLINKKPHKHALKRATGLFMLYFAPNIAWSLPNFLHDHAVVEIGGYWSSQGSQQTIDINGLNGDEFTVTNGHGKNVVVGAGYFFDGHHVNFPSIPAVDLTYGLNFFYLAKTSVSGEVIQEQLYNNLAYSYNVTHYPLYALARATLRHEQKYLPSAVTIDGGIGPNFMEISKFTETPLNNHTSPDTIFAGKNTVAFSATAGLSLRVNNPFFKMPLEIGYRFFYLGQGNFTKLNDQVLTTLNTGNNFGNALLCSIIF